MPMFVKQSVLEELREKISFLEAKNTEQSVDLARAEHRERTLKREMDVLQRTVEMQKDSEAESLKGLGIAKRQLREVQMGMVEKILDYKKRTNALTLTVDRLERELEARLSDVSRMETHLSLVEKEKNSVEHAHLSALSSVEASLQSTVRGAKKREEQLVREIKSLKQAAIQAPISDPNWGPHPQGEVT